MKRIKSIAAKILFVIARSKIGDAIIGRSFAYLTPLLPVNRLYETETVIAFHHPRPSHTVHILIVPKRSIKTVLDIDESDMPLFRDVVLAAQHLVRELQLQETGYRLMVNGGKYQDVGQVHFHLVSEASPA